MSNETKKLNARDKRIQDHARWAAEAFKDHVIEERLNNGMYRHWRCRRPGGDSAYWFDVTTTPGSIIVTGDIGELIVRRTEDMIAFCRGSINSIDYFAEKVPHSIPTDEFDMDVAEEWIDEQIRNAADYCYDSDDLEKLEELKHGLDETSEGSFARDLWDSGLNDGGDFPNVRNYNSNFLWCREALVWLIAHLPA